MFKIHLIYVRNKRNKSLEVMNKRKVFINYFLLTRVVY